MENKRSFMMGPIPGESLTKEPGAESYERPPKFEDPEEALEVYIDSLSDPEKRDTLFTVLESQVPVSSITKVFTRDGARKGIHSVDSSVILRPMLHEYIVTLAETAGVEYIEHPSDLTKDIAEKREKNTKLAPMISNKLRRKDKPKDEPKPKPKKGLMAPPEMEDNYE